MSSNAPASKAPASPAVRTQRLRAVVASTVGTTIEWYDFFLYGTAAALVFPTVFFPGHSLYSGILLSFGTQFVGFAARPIGAMIFGHYGDRIGRKTTLISTLLLMGTATFLMGLMPSYAAIGAAAPILLIVLRIVQGIGVGGEWGGSVLMSMEWGKQRRRGFMASWPQVGVPVGLLLSTGMVKLMSGVAGPGFDTWGWRVPFLASIILVGVGLYVRLRVQESPSFSELKRQQAIVRRPVWQVIKEQPREILCSAFVRMSEQAPFYLFVTFVLAYGTDHLGMSKDSLLNDTLVAAAIGLVSVPFFGYLSDLIGRRLMYGIGIVCVGPLRVPLLRPAQHQGRGPGPAGHRAVADLPRHAVRAAGRADRRILRPQRPLQRRRAGIPARLGHRRRPRAAHRRGDPERDRLQHLYQLVPGRLRGDLHDRAAADAAPRGAGRAVAVRRGGRTGSGPGSGGRASRWPLSRASPGGRAGWARPGPGRRDS